MAASPNETPRPRAPADALTGRGLQILTVLLAVVGVGLLCAGVVNYSYRTSVAVVGLGACVAILWNPFLGLLALIASLPFETLGMLGDP